MNNVVLIVILLSIIVLTGCTNKCITDNYDSYCLGNSSIVDNYTKYSYTCYTNNVTNNRKIVLNIR